MNQQLLVFDAHYLCHRAYHTSGKLSYGDKPTGVIYGFLRSILTLKELFNTDRVVFCFEGDNLFRKEDYPNYKLRRIKENSSVEELQERARMKSQISMLRDVYLPQIGFKNIFCAQGYESDDLMAVLAQRAQATDRVVLITADQDLFQCLRPGVIMYSPHQQKVFNEKWFTKTYRIPPRKWALVKAIAGCKSDNVAGIVGVGEKTALRFIRGELPDCAIYKKILSVEGRYQVRLNRALVELPYKGCVCPMLREDEISVDGWKKVCKMLGLRSIFDRPPVLIRKHS